MGVATIDDVVNYAAPLINAVFTTKPQVQIGSLFYTIALVSDIPIMTPYALLASPNFTGTPTLSSQPLLARARTLSPAYYNAGRRIELDCSTASIARLDFHSSDSNTAADYDGKIT